MTPTQIDGGLLGLAFILLLLAACGLWALWHSTDYAEFLAQQRAKERWRQMMEDQSHG